jgi:hypothetical protein
MPHYLQQVAYSIKDWKALVKKPQNRIEAVRIYPVHQTTQIEGE